jgi:hypothetical protein
MPMHQCIISRDDLLPVTHADTSSDTTSTTTRAWSKSKSSPPWKRAALSKGSATGLKKEPPPVPMGLPALNLRCAYPSAPSRAGQTQTPDGGRCLTPCLTQVVTLFLTCAPCPQLRVQVSSPIFFPRPGQVHRICAELLVRFQELQVGLGFSLNPEPQTLKQNMRRATRTLQRLAAAAAFGFQSLGFRD